jgi:hypothetical protein
VGRQTHGWISVRESAISTIGLLCELIQVFYWGLKRLYSPCHSP